MGQWRAPLLERLLGYQGLPLWSFHTPGHKQGKGLDADLARLLEQFARADVSLMGDELDDPFHPVSCIREAQGLLAELYGAERSYFSAIGTTGALQVLMLASFQEGDKVLLPRNAHRSLWGGLVLSGAKPVFLSPQYDEDWQISHGISIEVLEHALELHPDAKGLILVSPTYYGVIGELEKLVELAHQRGLTVLVDEAHGAHLRFLENPLLDGISAGADGVAQSAHKLLGAFTGASWLHIQGKRVLPEKIEQAFLALQTSSPNYPLLASLDGARRQLATAGRAEWVKICGLAERLRADIQKIPGLACLSSLDIEGGRLDPCKITVDMSGLGLSGAEAAMWLREQRWIQPELADINNVLFLLTYSDGESEVAALLAALQDLAAAHSGQRSKKAITIEVPPVSEVVLTPRQVFFAGKKSVSLGASIGEIAGEPVSFYPPGIPLVWPGEVITAEQIGQIKTGLEAGLQISGPLDGSLERIQIVEAKR